MIVNIFLSVEGRTVINPGRYVLYKYYEQFSHSVNRQA